MARQPRIDFPGAFHHVMNRGAAHQEIFRNSLDRRLFLSLWEQAVSRFEIEVIAFALMSNHYHFFVHSPDGQLSKAMQFIGRAYTQEFNYHHDRDGALFRGRFHSVLIEAETHFSRVVRYIELNPVEAGLCSVSELANYNWSSFRYSAGFTGSPWWLSTARILDHFGAAQEYRKFVESRIEDTELKRLHARPRSHGSVLGSPSFIESVSNSYPELSTQLRAAVPNPTLAQIETSILKLSGASPHDLFAVSAQRHPARTAAILLSHGLTTEPRTRLAHRYGFASSQTFLTAVRRAKQRPKSEAVQRLESAVLNELGCT